MRYPLALLLLHVLLLLHQPLFSVANVHKLNLLRSELLSQPTPRNDDTPTLFFEVTKPIELPKAKPCTQHVLQHDFGYTYGKPPVFANYTPPSYCPSQSFSKIVLEWKATCKGRQYDRIFGLWLGGVEILRGCTAEPTQNGIVWSVKKDVTRSVSSTGWVKSSYGNITTDAIQDFHYSNTMVMRNDANTQIVNQIIHFNDTVNIRPPSSSIHSMSSNKTFPLYLYADYLEQANESYTIVKNVELGFIEKKSASVGSRFSNSSLRNLQNAEVIIVVKNKLLVRGLGSTQQVYRFDGPQSCYFRNISSSNYTILYDKVRITCTKKPESNLDFGLSRLWPFGAQRNFPGPGFT